MPSIPPGYCRTGCGAAPGAGEHGEDVAAPTTIIVDKHGVVRAFFRPTNVASRLSASDVLAAVDKKLAVP